MRWCLRVKLFNNWDKFSTLLLSTEDLPIVEESNKDDFWGAKPVDINLLIGTNALGRLLMELRDEIKTLESNKEYILNPLTSLISCFMVEKLKELYLKCLRN